MSENVRNQPGESQGRPDRASDGPRRTRFEGFEGMNYEQRRQPYNPQRKKENSAPMNPSMNHDDANRHDGH